jgi:hypothetical protein
LAGYNLMASDITDAYHSEDELWSAINPVFQTKSRNSTSYKYCFLKAILDNIFNVNADLVLPFYVVFERFTEIYWNLIIKFQAGPDAGTQAYRRRDLDSKVRC